MDLSQLISKRRMVRNYRSEPVARETVERILDKARRAPSAGFTQGQSFIVVTNPATRQAIAELAHEPEYVADGFDPWISSAPVHIVVCTSEAAYRAVLRVYDHRSTLEGFKAPDAIYRLGHIYLNKEKIDQAEYYFTNVARRFPQSTAGQKAQRELDAIRIDTAADGKLRSGPDS